MPSFLKDVLVGMKKKPSKDKIQRFKQAFELNKNRKLPKKLK